ncbi:substrate-binding domain-containing protein [Salibacterium sp. K-3]
MKPKYQMIIDDIKSSIFSGDYKQDKKIPTESTLQSRYEVSRQTVRKAISELSNEGFLRTEKGSGTYVINQHPSNHPSRADKKTICVITTYISDYIFPSIIRGIESRLNDDDFSLLLASTNNNVEQERNALETMLSFGVDGLIIEPTKSNLYNPNIAYYMSFKEQDVPIIMINAHYDELDVPFLCLDDVQSGYIATGELISKGHSGIGLIAKMDDLQGKYRMRGFIQAIGEAKLEFNPEHVLSYTTESKSELYADVKKFLTENKDTLTAIVCYNDEVGLEVANVCRELNIAIPDELSIIGQDNSYIAKNANIHLSTLTHPQEQMGRDAADWVIKKLQGTKNLPNETYYQPDLVPGETIKELEDKMDDPLS